MSSPLESPDIMQTFIPFCDISAATTSMASIKLSADSINNKSQQVRHIHLASSFSNSTSTSNHNSASSASIPHDTVYGGGGGDGFVGGGRSHDPPSSLSTTLLPHSTAALQQHITNTDRIMSNHERTVRFGREYHHGYAIGSKPNPLVEFSISSVGRSFIDEMEDNDGSITNISLKTPDTPTTPNISPSSSNRFSETFSNDFLKTQSPSAMVSPISDKRPSQLPFSSSSSGAGTSATANDDGDCSVAPRANYSGSWDLLELDLDFHDVNFDPSFGGDVEEKEFLGDDADDPLGVLPTKPTPPGIFRL